MARLLVLAILAALLATAAISSASTGLLSRIPDMSGTRKIAFVGILCLVGLAGWRYWEGDFDYLIWLRSIPDRPATEVGFVSLVQDALNRWTDEQSPNEAACRQATTAIEAPAQPATNWTGTVYIVYRVGSKLGLVVRIGRFTALRTSYIEEKNSILLEPGSSAFDQAVTLASGDPVRFSGAIVADTTGCAFHSDVVGQATGAEFLFRFTQLQRE
jgi:hypothetical protein